MTPKFKYGDEILAGPHEGKIVSVIKTSSGYRCSVRFDDKKLKPSVMTYDEQDVKFRYDHTEVCPFCRNKWKITKYNKQVWKDCTKCNGKAEDLIDEHKMIQDNTVKKKHTIEDKEKALLDEFEKLLDEDEEEDFGFFGI